MNQARGGEPSDLLAMKGCWITVGAKPLHVIDETFGSIPTDGTKCRYLISLDFGASVGLRELAKKKKKGDGVPIASPMLKLPKRMEKILKPIGVGRIAYLFSVGGFRLYLNFSLIFGNIILSCQR